MNLFGETQERVKTLADKFIIPPFSVLEKRSHKWQQRKKYWLSRGIKSELGRSVIKTNANDFSRFTLEREYVIKGATAFTETNGTNSIFDPVLCEIIYKWFGNEGSIIDPFAGGSVRGIIASLMGLDYTGIELRTEQVESNYEQANKITPSNVPTWIVGDSDVRLSEINEQFDLAFTCPPYFNLEVYSSHKDDISNMSIESFEAKYKSILSKTASKIKPQGFFVIVISNIRDRKGNYIDLSMLTRQALYKVGMKLYNEMIMVTPIGTKAMTVQNSMRNNKLGRVHEEVLCFKF